MRMNVMDLVRNIRGSSLERSNQPLDGMTRETGSDRNHCSRFMGFICVLFVCIAGVVCSPAYAQMTTADIVGTVTDSTGAVVPDSKVAITNLGTKVSASKQSNESGDYTFNLLIPGHYSVVVELTGFKKYQVADVALAAGDRVRIDAKLQTGSVEENVEVTATAPLLQTDSSSVSSVVTEQAVQDLPLNGRNYINLVQIQPGVTAGQPNAVSSGNRPDDRRASSTVSSNGQPDVNNSQMIDGMDNNEREQGFIGVRPSIDAIAEVKVDTNAYNAEIGRVAGAVVNIITKSGDNTLHGSAYEYFRNDTFDARDFFAKVGKTQKPEYRQNQFGGSVGGPIRKDKTFFFADVEENRIIQGATHTLTVPTLFEEENPGDFSDIGGPKISTTLDPVGLSYFKMYPKPNLSGTSSNYVGVTKTTQYATTADARIDHHLSNGDQFFGRYSYNKSDAMVPSALPEAVINGVTIEPGVAFSYEGPSTTRVHGVQFNYIHVLTPNLILELKTGYTRIDIESLNLNKGNVSSEIGLVNANTTAAPETGGLMPLSISGYTSPGDGGFLPIIDINNTFQYTGSLTYTHDAHNIKMGATSVRRQLNYYQSSFPLGYVLFTGMTGNSLADLLEGNPLGYIRGNTMIKPGYRMWESAGYVQDDWRITHSLTLNLGVRYDLMTPISEAHGHYANFDYATQKIITGTKDSHIGVHTNYKNFAPRVGFAQSIGKSTVIRGGYGISYYPAASQTQIQAANPPYQYANTCIPCFGSFTWPTLPVPVVSSTTNLSGSLSSLAPDFNTSYVEEFSLTAQREFGANVLTVGYVGELSKKVLFQPYINIPAPTGPYTDDSTNGPSAAPALLTASTLPNVGEIQEFAPRALGNYNAMQAIFARRFTRGISFNANYTWAHGLTDGSQTGSGLSGVNNLEPANPMYDYGNSQLDVRHRIAASFNYQLPFGQSAHGVQALLMKGWSTNFIGYWQSGLPFTVSSSATNRNGLAQINLPDITSDRPDVVAGKSFHVSNPSNSKFFNVDAFTPQAAGTAGNERNQQLFGPHYRRADLSLFKNINFTPKYGLQFRAECYNISNTPNYSAPNSTITNWAPGPKHLADGSNPISKVGPLPGDTPDLASGFGQITSTAANINPRQFQFALKLLF